MMLYIHMIILTSHSISQPTDIIAFKHQNCCVHVKPVFLLQKLNYSHLIERLFSAALKRTVTMMVVIRRVMGPGWRVYCINIPDIHHDQSYTARRERPAG